jgi:hypothetical protein
MSGIHRELAVVTFSVGKLFLYVSTGLLMDRPDTDYLKRPFTGALMGNA